MTKLLLKKSSVVGKIPLVGDLSYGELALNYADGKIYYKTSSNTIEAFLDSANIVSLIQANSLDSSEVTNLIDADYVNNLGVVGTDSAAVLQLIADNSVDSAEVINLIDSDYVQARTEGSIGSANQIILNSFSGDSSTTAFTLSTSPSAEHLSFVTINGVEQHVDAYSIVGNTLTLDAAPEVGDDIEVRTFRLQAGEVELRDYAEYVYQPSASTTSFSDSDINGNILSYQVGKLDVHLNGAKLVNGLDYTATNGTSVNILGDAAVSGDTVSITSFAKASIIDDVSRTTLTTTSANQPVDSFSAASRRTAKYIVQMTQNSRYHSSEVLLVHNGSTAYMTTYADMYTESDLGTIDADVSSGNVRLLISPNYANTTVKTKRIDVEV